MKLVGDGHDARLDQGQQQVVFQRIEQLGRCRRVQDLVLGRLETGKQRQIRLPGTDDGVLGQQPDPEDRLALERLSVDDPARRRVSIVPAPVADAEYRAHVSGRSAAAWPNPVSR